MRSGQASEMRLTGQPAVLASGIRALWTEEEKTTGVGGKGHCSQQGRNSRET